MTPSLCSFPPVLTFGAEACYDKVSTSFRLIWFVNDGAPSPKVVEKLTIFFFFYDPRRVPRPHGSFHPILAYRPIYSFSPNRFFGRDLKLPN